METSDSDPTSSRWRIDQRSLLSECGIPDSVAHTTRQWTYVLLHGNDAMATGWNPTWITSEQASKLLAALERDLQNESGFELIRELRGRASS